MGITKTDMQSNLDERYKPATSPTIGNRYHLVWAHAKCRWILDDLHSDGIHCWMYAPVSRKYLKAKISDLRLLLPSAKTYKNK